MRATSTRRLLVFVVCAFGVGALYFVPGITSSPGRLGAEPERPTQSRARPRSSRVVGPQQSHPIEDVGVGPDATSAAGPANSGRQTAIHTAAAAGVVRDRTRPSPVTELSVDRVTPETVSLHWAPTRDDEGAVSYRVWLNGYEVAATTDSRATVEWFNDDTDQHVLQVRALDDAGNVSEASRSLLVSRPDTAPSATSAPSTEPSIGLSPDGRPSETSQPGDTQ